MTLQLHSSILDPFLGGGIPFGSVVEWGSPREYCGRELIVSYLAHATQGLNLEAPFMCLWIYTAALETHSQLRVYPPAWSARSVDLERMRFAASAKPVAELKPVFLNSFFKVVVIDTPQHFSHDDLAFVARKARANKQVVLLLRNYLLTSELGNVWAKMRLNCCRIPATTHEATAYQVDIIRGWPPKKFTLELL